MSEDNKGSKSEKNVKISKEGYDQILNKVFLNIQEERNLALDRYRIQDEQIKTQEDFVLQGKDVVSYLKLASERTNSLLDIAKEIKQIAYVSELNAKSVAINSTSSSDDERKEMESFIKSLKSDKKDIQDIENDVTED